MILTLLVLLGRNRPYLPPAIHPPHYSFSIYGNGGALKCDSLQKYNKTYPRHKMCAYQLARSNY